MGGVCCDFVRCRYKTRERVLKIDIFQGVLPTCVLHEALHEKRNQWRLKVEAN